MPWAVVTAAALLGTAGTALALGPASLDPTTAASWRAVLGAGGLGLGALVRRRNPFLLGPSWRWAIVGGASFAINQVAFFTAIDRIGVATGTLVTVAMIPLAAGAIEWISSERSPRLTWVLGVTLGVIGVAALTLDGVPQLGPGGLTAAGVAGFTAAIVVWSSQRLVGTIGAHLAMTAIVSIGAVLLAPRALYSIGTISTVHGFVTVLWLGVVTLAIAYWLIGVGVARHTLSSVGATTMLEPAVATVLAATVVGEHPTTGIWVGMVFVVAGIGLAAVPGGRTTDIRRGLP